MKVDGDTMMEWKLPRRESSHHLTRVGCRLLGIHLYEDPREPAGWRYDCSLDGVSVVTGNNLWIRESTPCEGGCKRWDLDLSDHRVRLGLYHKALSGTILLELNGEPVTTLSMDVDTPEGDYYLHLLGHRVGIHIRDTGDFSFRYDCSVSGCSVTTGKMVTPSQMLANEGGYAWMEHVDGATRLFRLEHSPFRNRGTLWVDGKKLGSSGSFWEDRKETWYSFRWSQHHVMVRVREVREFEFEYLPIMNGRSVITGEPVQPPENKEGEVNTARNVWVLELPDGPHRVEIGGTFMLRIRVDGVAVAKKPLWDWGDSWHPFTIGNHSCAVLFQPGTITYRTMLWVDGTNASTGKEMLPLKVIPAGGRPKWWMFRTHRGVRRVELHHQRWLGGVCRISLDGEPILKQRRWDRNSLFHFEIDGLPCRLEIRYDPEDDRYQYDLWVNDHRMETGKRIPQNQEEKRPSRSAPPSWRQRLQTGVGSYLFGVVTLYVFHSFFHWLEWDDPREPAWYFALPLFPAVTYSLKGSKAEKWILAALGVMMSALAGTGLYIWMSDH